MSRRVNLRHMQSIGGAPCKVIIQVYQDGEATSEHTVDIKSTRYRHGHLPRLPMGRYALSWTSEDTAYFYKWETADKVSVEDAYDASTDLIVSCGGTLTLKLMSNPAFNYDNLVGTIWVEDPGHNSYDSRE